MKRKLLGLTTATMIFAGGAIYAFNGNQAECELKGTPDCPLVEYCPLMENTAEVVKTANDTMTEVLPDCCKKKYKQKSN